MRVRIVLSNGEYREPTFARELDITKKEYEYLQSVMRFDRMHTTDTILNVIVLDNEKH